MVDQRWRGKQKFIGYFSTFKYAKVEEDTIIYHAQLNMPEIDELCEVYEDCLSILDAEDKMEAFAVEAVYLENSFLLIENINCWRDHW